jgi:hypothetical protein
MANRTTPTRLFAALLFLAVSCGEGQTGPGAPAAVEVPPHLRDDTGALAIAIRTPGLTAGIGLQGAIDDLNAAFGAISGADLSRNAEDAVILVAVEEAVRADLGDEGFRLATSELTGVPTLTVLAGTQTGAMYGLYTIARDLGVTYHHPEETFYPSDPNATLPWDYGALTEEVPDFALRGFHEHTQHPIVMSDFLLRPDESVSEAGGGEAFREYVSRYLRWYARNRQNTLFFHFLKTVDLDAWVPYMQDIVAEAHDYGVRVGMVIGFADQQQNAFKLIREDDLDADGDMRPPAEQIPERLDAVLAAGLDYIGFQIGTSEFTKPSDEEALSWIQIAVDHIAERWPDVEPFAWIHITCSLESDDGGYYYHLPLEADARLGAFVHTTMFYTLDLPAPVYDCADFTHQQAFFDEADGERDLVFFPETGWWLGFDNNMPLVTPITGWSRQHDIQDVLPQWDVRGHVTFTTGREWTYWQYDHYLTRATWDRETTWDDYLGDIAPLYGERGEAVADALRAWTALQRRHFYEVDPLIYFYLAGELAQDEIGVRAGILARRPKIAFVDVVGWDDDTFAAWEEGDLALLASMRAEYAEVFDALPAAEAGGDTLGDALYGEVYDALQVYVLRIDHALALYRGTAEARRWRVESQSEAPDEAVRGEAREAADGYLEEAEAITEQVRGIIAGAEARYRYPLELLAEDKPESLTAYPFGYLAETRSAFFWTRRDAQLAALIERVFDERTEGWTVDPAPELVHFSDAENTTMLVPSNPLAAQILSGFLPRLLFGLARIDEAGGTMTLAVAQDLDASDLPDPDTEVDVAGVIDGDTWTASGSVHPIAVYDAAGVQLGTMNVLQPQYELVLEREGGELVGATEASIAGSFTVETLLEIVLAIDGVDREAAEVLLKSIYGLPPNQPLPTTLPIHFVWRLRR